MEPILAEFLKHEYGYVRDSAIQIVSKRKYAPAIPDLIALVPDEAPLQPHSCTGFTPVVGSTAVKALVELGVKEAVPELAKLLPHNPRGQEAAYAIARIGADESKGILLEALANAPDHWTRQYAAWALAEVKGDSDVVQALKSALEKEREGRVLEAARRSLDTLGG